MMTVDAVIVGGGAAGLATAIGLARAGLSATVLGLPADIRDDGRSAALFESSLAFLDGLALGDRLRERGAPLRAIRIIDLTNGLVRAPDVLFRASEIGQEAFGWNIPNAAIIEEMIAAAREETGLTLSTALFSGLETTGDAIIVRTDAGEAIRTRLLVGADGQASPVRQAAGITHREKPYPQVALTARLTHSRDHNDESLEFHTREGPFTFVPLGPGTSALVWILRPENAEAMLALSPGEIALKAQRRSFNALGDLAIEGRIGRVPMRKLVADRLTAPRLALVGEAAHAFPPIGAQGLNLGLRDVAALVEHAGVAFREGRDVGAEQVLSGYARDRRVDVEARAAGVDLMNSALIGGLLPLDLARAAGLTLLRDLPPLRRLAMRLGGGGGLFGKARHAPVLPR